ncbi:MAG: hypothetical protein JNK82_15430 [Myxococcaceae bacterium]|nr:hypothetical protein [Myxococcaceae bacterium]
MPSSNGGCTTPPMPDCAQQHAEGDAFEPDECPSLAKVIVPGQPPQTRGISPVADEDWLRVSAERGQVLRLAIAGASYPIRIEVFELDAVTPVAADERGLINPIFTFHAPNSQGLLVRLRALRTNEAGPYTVQVDVLGFDDFPNDATAAPRLAVDAVFEGGAQYAGDVDFATITVAQGRAYEVALSLTSINLPAGVARQVTTSGLSARVSVFDASGSVLLAGPQSLSLTYTPAVSGAFFVRVQATNMNALGAYTVRVN